MKWNIQHELDEVKKDLGYRKSLPSVAMSFPKLEMATQELQEAYTNLLRQVLQWDKGDEHDTVDRFGHGSKRNFDPSCICHHCVFRNFLVKAPPL